MPKRSSLSRRLARLESVSRPEVKYKGDTSGAFDTVGSISGTLLKPQTLQQGIGRNNRIGDKCKSRNIRFQAIFKMPSSASNDTCALRVLVLRSKIQHPSTSDMPSWYGSVDEDKFFVLKDILTQVSIVTRGTGNNNAGSTLKKVKFNVPTGLRKLQYDGSSSTPTDPVNRPVNNEVVIYMFAENQSGEVAYNWQHYYLDN